MAFFESLTFSVTAKALAATAGLAIAGGGIAAVATANVPAESGTGQAEQGADPAADTQDTADVHGVRGVTTLDTDTEAAPDASDTVEADAAGGNEVSEAVHATLSGTDSRPGDEDFGQDVADNARSGEPGDFGRSVADAAREANSSADRGDTTGDEAANQGGDHGTGGDAANQGGDNGTGGDAADQGEHNRDVEGRAHGEDTARDRSDGASDTRGPSD